MSTLLCPATKQRLHRVPVDEANAGREPLRVRPRTQSRRTPIGVTRDVLLREDGEAAYPISDDIPIVLPPEMLVRNDAIEPIDVMRGPYAEAYAEMEFYDGLAGRREELAESVAMLRKVAGSAFLEPVASWLDAEFDGSAQLDCYRHLAPNLRGTVMQVGGKGLHLAKFLLAGAHEAWLLTPMLEEARWAIALATELGVRDRLRAVVGVAEEMPFADATFDAIYAGGTMHHLVIELAAAELRRVLRDGGTFAAAEPWKAPAYTWGVRVFGKREPSVHCRPIDDDRLTSLRSVFPHAACLHHGAVLRYPLIALGKLGIHLGEENVRRIISAGDAVSARIPRLHRMGSSVSLLATRVQ